MTTIAKRPLKRKIAILAALSVMWLGGGIGLWLLHRDGGWDFILLNGHDIGTVAQIGAYYLARVAAQLPSVGIAVMIIGMSDFKHPVRIACVTVLGYHGVMTVIRLLFGRAWPSVPSLDQRVPALAELAQLGLLVVLAGFVTWFMFWMDAWVKTGPLARYDH
jgi:hypothetical protein